MSGASTDYDTTRVSASEQDRAVRAERDRRAPAYLERTGNQDVAPILGLVESPPPRAQHRDRIGRDVTSNKKNRKSE